MAYTITLDATGRDIVNAINAGKAVMIRTVDFDSLTHFVMPDITFDEYGEGYLSISFSIASDYYSFTGSLDDTVVCSTDSGGGFIA